MMPMTPTSVILFSLVMGALWLATVPLTSGLVAYIYGVRYMGTLYGFVFFSHQLGAFLGVWLGGRLYDIYGNYDLVWWVGIGVGAFSAIVHLPIRERPMMAQRRLTGAGPGAGIYIRAEPAAEARAHDSGVIDMGYRVVVAGATGNVGREMLNILAEREFPVDEIAALASRKSLGTEVSFGDRTVKTKDLDTFDFTGWDIALFAVGSEATKIYAPRAAAAGCVVIDNSSLYR